VASLIRILLFTSFFTIFHYGLLQAQTRSNLLYPGGPDPRGPAELTLCGQNLQNFGTLKDFLTRNRGQSAQAFFKKKEALAKRIASQNCDVIAVQEVLGRDEVTSIEALQGLADQIRIKNNRFYQPIVGPSNDPFLRLGYLVAIDRVEVLNKVSYYKVELPKITEDQKPRLFTRGPLELQIKIKAKGQSYSKVMTLINYHFKSKAASGKDLTQTGWESFRMEMSEALRRIVENRHAESFKSADSLLVLLGDRNSHYDAASAKILEGVLRLSNFQTEAACRLSKRGVPLCHPGVAGPQILFSLLTLDPQTKVLPGTHQYKKVYSWLDEISAPAETLKFAKASFDSEGDYDSGIVYETDEASDHAMTYVRFNW